MEKLKQTGIKLVPSPSLQGTVHTLPAVQASQLLFRTGKDIVQGPIMHQISHIFIPDSSGVTHHTIYHAEKTSFNLKKQHI